ncbi:MAG: hypothetical protein H0U74_20100 [Bradymonadaceae bacterium]|nr:hypothetical protein [Lujinxingiaceae bacterium]
MPGARITIHLHAFSEARRVFALNQVQQAALRHHDRELAALVAVAISHDHDTVRLNALWKCALARHQVVIADETALARLLEIQREEVDAFRKKGQDNLVAIIARILTTYGSDWSRDVRARQDLLGPICDHNLRLHLGLVGAGCDEASSFAQIELHA